MCFAKESGVTDSIYSHVVVFNRGRYTVDCYTLSQGTLKIPMRLRLIGATGCLFGTTSTTASRFFELANLDKIHTVLLTMLTDACKPLGWHRLGFGLIVDRFHHGC